MAFLNLLKNSLISTLIIGKPHLAQLTAHTTNNIKFKIRTQNSDIDENIERSSKVNIILAKADTIKYIQFLTKLSDSKIFAKQKAKPKIKSKEIKNKITLYRQSEFTYTILLNYQ